MVFMWQEFIDIIIGSTNIQVLSFINNLKYILMLRRVEIKNKKKYKCKRLVLNEFYFITSCNKLW